MKKLHCMRRVLHIVKLDEPGTDWLVLEMKLDCFPYVGAQLIPGLRLSKDAVAESPGEVAAFLSVADFKNQFHVFRILNRGWASLRRDRGGSVGMADCLGVG